MQDRQIRMTREQERKWWFSSFRALAQGRLVGGGGPVLFPLILRIFQFCHKYNCKYYHKYKSNKKAIELGPWSPHVRLIFYLLFLLNHNFFVYCHGYITNTNANTSTHPKVKRRRCCFHLSFEYFNAMDSFLSPLQHYQRSPQLCALQNAVKG